MSVKGFNKTVIEVRIIYQDEIAKNKLLQYNSRSMYNLLYL